MSRALLTVAKTHAFDGESSLAARGLFDRGSFGVTVTAVEVNLSFSLFSIILAFFSLSLAVWHVNK